jgi:transcriptional regulator with XRE-family HTH domain
VSDPDKVLRERLVADRKAAKLTQKQLAKALGWQQRKISEIESGKQAPILKELDRIAAVLEKDALEWLNEAYRRARGSISR